MKIKLLLAFLLFFFLAYFPFFHLLIDVRYISYFFVVVAVTL